MYILLADNRNDNDKKWKNILTDNQYDLLEKNNFYILGFMLAHTTDQNNLVHYIDFIVNLQKGKPASVI